MHHETTQFLPDFTLKRFTESGYCIVEDVISASLVEELRIETDRIMEANADRSGVRNMLDKSAKLREVAESSPIANLAREFLGVDARPVKLTLFDKTPQSNWKVPWHQDLTIAVRERREVDGFGPWSVKDGVIHVQPPSEILEGIIALRLHLDDTPAENGALKVLPGTHRHGRLSRSAINQLKDQIEEVACPVQAGGVMIMSPLLLHASSASASPAHRRVLHFEYSATDLPGGLRWI